MQLSLKQFCLGGGPDAVIFDPTMLGLNLKMQEASFTLQEEMKKWKGYPESLKKSS